MLDGKVVLNKINALASEATETSLLEFNSNLPLIDDYDLDFADLLTIIHEVNSALHLNLPTAQIIIDYANRLLNQRGLLDPPFTELEAIPTHEKIGPEIARLTANDIYDLLLLTIVGQIAN